MTSPHVLVAYASKNGSTAQIAEWIGDDLTSRGIETDVRPADDVGDLIGYDAVVLGSAVYTGRWLRSATRFARRHRRVLLELPVCDPVPENDRSARRMKLSFSVQA